MNNDLNTNNNINDKVENEVLDELVSSDVAQSEPVSNPESSNYIEQKLIETEKELLEAQKKSEEHKSLANAMEEQLVNCNESLKSKEVELDQTKKELKTEKSKPKKKPFRFFRWLFGCLFKLIILALLVVFVYFNISQIQNNKYSNLKNGEFANLVLKESSIKNKALISVEDFNGHLDNIRRTNSADLPLDFEVSKLFYDNESGAFVANIDGQFVSTSLLLYGEYKDDKFNITNANLGRYNISIDWLRERIALPIDGVANMITEAFKVSPAISINSAEFYSDGIMISSVYNKDAIVGLSSTFKSNIDNALVESGVIADFEQSNQIYSELIKTENPDEIAIEKVLNDSTSLATLISLMDDSKVKSTVDAIEKATNKKVELNNIDRILKTGYTTKIKARMECQSVAQKLEETTKLVEEKDKAIEELNNQIEALVNEKAELQGTVNKYTTTKYAKWDEQGTNTKLDDEHNSSKINDGVIETAWGTKENKGLGEVIYFKSKAAQSISKLSIINGLSTAYKANNRVNKILVEYSNGESSILQLDPENQPIQYFDINKKNINWIRITILGVTDGEQDDAATYISELQFELMKDL